MFFNKKKATQSAQAAQNDDRINVDTSTITTMVGVDTVVEGLLKTKSSIRINGKVIGDVRADGIVVLTKTGYIEGTIEAESIIVAGVVRGNMSIRDKVNVEASGEIYGEVITKKFVIDEESVFQGNCIMNRDGKLIPATPYISEEEKAEMERLEKEKAEKEKAEKEKAENKKESDKKDDDKEDKDTEEEKSDKDESEESDDSNKKDSEESDSEESDSDDSTTDSDKDDSKSSEIIIANINEVEAADDIPASDNAGESHHSGNKNRHHRKNYVKKSKSLSVEIQDE